MTLDFKTYRDKVLGCWWGKYAGGTLGAPFECKRGVIDLDGYIQKNPRSIPNDDLDLQLVILRACEKYGDKVDAQVLAEYWLSYISASLSEYGSAKRNLRGHIAPPLSGTFANPNRNSCGAFIRSEIWACLCAGNPDIAVCYAYEDASVDHGEEGVYGEIFCAAVQAYAFIESDIENLLKKGLQYIPENCGVARGVKTAMQAYQEGKDWKKARIAVLKEVPSSFGQRPYKGISLEEDAKHPVAEHGYDAPGNVSLGVLGLLYGEKDFGKTICIAAGCMEDADCTAGFAGATLGIMLGKRNLPERWLRPLGNEIAICSLRTDTDLMLPRTVEELCERILRLTPVFLGVRGVDTLSKGEGYRVRVMSIPELLHIHAIRQMPPDLDNSPDFSFVRKRINNGVRFQGVLFDTTVFYKDGCSVRQGAEVTIEFEFWNKLYDPQLLEMHWYLPEGIECVGGNFASVPLDQRHGGFNIAKREFMLKVNDISSVSIECLVSIKSVSRYLSTYIPIILVCD